MRREVYILQGTVVAFYTLGGQILQNCVLYQNYKIGSFFDEVI